MAKIKMIRETTKEALTLYSPFSKKYTPASNPFDQIFSFLICKKFRFTVDENNSIEYEDKIPQRHWHNLILSIDDGCFSYKTKSGTKNLCFPINGDSLHQHNWLAKNQEEISDHIIIFLSSLYTGIKFTTILSVDLGCYLSDNVCTKIK